MVGDIHGSMQSVLRHILRWINMGVLDSDCTVIGDVHIVFLGDVISYGTQQYEALMLIYMLKAVNPDNVHLN